MATYTPEQLGIKAPTGGFQTGGWYSGRQFWGGTLSEPGVIHPSSNQSGAGQLVSKEVNAQSAVQQGVTPQQLEDYLASQRKVVPKPATTPAPTGLPSQGTTPSAGSGAGTGTAGALTAPTQASIDLPSMYKNLYESSGVTKLEADLSQKEKEFIEAKGKINDNPWLSEATRVGRVAKMEQLYNERTANLKKDIATKKADIETQLNLQTKQFDINSQQAKDSLARLNTLLSMGALANASGDDIANITRATGISSGMIQSAIDATKKKADTQVITSTADNGVVTVSVINKDTGEVISQKSLGAIGNKQTGGSSTTTGYGAMSDKYLEKANDILKQAEVQGQSADVDGKKTPDGYISKEEAQQARSQIIALVGDEKLGQEIFERAFNAGGYKPWNW